MARGCAPEDSSFPCGPPVGGRRGGHSRRRANVPRGTLLTLTPFFAKARPPVAICVGGKYLSLRALRETGQRRIMSGYLPSLLNATCLPPSCTAACSTWNNLVPGKQSCPNLCLNLTSQLENVPRGTFCVTLKKMRPL